MSEKAKYDHSKPEAGRYVRAKELAERLSISRATFYRMASRPDFPAAMKIGPKTTVWSWDEVNAWIESRRKAQGGAA